MNCPQSLIIALLLYTLAACVASPGRAKEHEIGRQVCVYAGSGAVLARDVELALDKLGMPHARVSESDVKAGGLKGCSLLIIPGGYTARCVDSLGEEGFERIREFVADGGGYIGICAGAYLAPNTVEMPGHLPGLGIINIRNRREAGMGVRAIESVKSGHPVGEGYERKVRIWYQNGPMIEAGEGVETLAVYERGSAAVVCSTYGKGKVVIFSPHPEGSLSAGVDPQRMGTLKLLENAVLFAKSE